ncbi:MAG: bacteriochlorophyll 4-vinyl reductase [Pseudomonadota bacterium]
MSPPCASARTPHPPIVPVARLGEVARVGPNAVTQLIAAMDAAHVTALKRSVFEAAHCARYLEHPPTEMIPEYEAAFVHRSLIAQADPARARSLAEDAGRRTADYIIANRIPAPARLILKALPASRAAPMLADAIARHAWTFCGSGRFKVARGGPRRLTLSITDNALATPGCPWHVAVFERLFQTLAGANARVAHRSAGTSGAQRSDFSVTY